jgi:aconitate hydratase
VYKSSLSLQNKTYQYFSIEQFEQKKGVSVKNLPFSLKILLENLLRYFDNDTVQDQHLDAIVDWLKNRTSSQEINYRPARVLMQDFTGVPAVVDLAAMRDAVAKLGGDPKKINPLSPVELVIDHSVQVDKYANLTAFKDNVDLEMSRNGERYQFLRWGQSAFDNFKVVPPGTGICHQVNLEYIAQCVWQNTVNGETVAYPDTLVGTDSHTTMVNGLGVLGWGVGGIEAEAAMLGQPVSMLIPEVIGFKLNGELPEGVTATDLVLRVTQMLRERGVVGKFVEFFGPGLDELPLADRATIANMAPEYGATCGFFPIDDKTIDYLKLTARSEETIELVEAYCKAQGMWREHNTPDPEFTDTLELDLSDVRPALAGPKRPQDRVDLNQLKEASSQVLSENGQTAGEGFNVPGEDFKLNHGDLVIAAITSCTNTSNPSVLMAAGLVAKKALEKGLVSKPWVKTSLAPGSKVVTEYLEKSGLQTYLDDLGFNLVGYGCTTCIGNSGPLKDSINQAITDNQLVVSSVLSGNRNFEGRVHPLVKANWLASPPLVVAFALAGTTLIDLESEAIGQDKDGNDVHLKDIWPSNAEVAAEVAKITEGMFKEQYADVYSGDADWQAIPVTEGNTYDWQNDSTYIQNPPFFEGLSHDLPELSDITDAHILAKLGDSVTTDHISPAGNIKADSPAGEYLKDNGIEAKDFNSYGSRRGNHEVMMRGTFANIRIRNEMLDGVEGGYTKHVPSGEQMSIYDAAMRYQAEGQQLVVVAGKEYGTGSSRDWAAKGTRLLGVKAVITESFERIHRSNLIGMGVLPLQFTGNDTRSSLKLTGDEQISITGLDALKPRGEVNCTIKFTDGSEQTVSLLCRIDTANELTYYRNGGILHYVLRKLLSK